MIECVHEFTGRKGNCQICGESFDAKTSTLVDKCVPCDLCGKPADERFGPVNACPNCYEEAEQISRRRPCRYCGHGIRLVGTTFKCLGCSFWHPGRWA